MTTYFPYPNSSTSGKYPYPAVSFHTEIYALLLSDFQLQGIFLWVPMSGECLPLVHKFVHQMVFAKTRKHSFHRLGKRKSKLKIQTEPHRAQNSNRNKVFTAQSRLKILTEPHRIQNSNFNKIITVQRSNKISSAHSANHQQPIRRSSGFKFTAGQSEKSACSLTLRARTYSH